MTPRPNNIWRRIWNEIRRAWTGSLIAKGRGTMTTGRELGLLLILASTATALAAPPNPPAPTQLPTGGRVVAGQAAIAQSAAVMHITQSTPRAAIDWQTFNVGAQAQVHFVQPSAGSVTLNRVLDANPSQIFGRISAIGQVFFTNPNGVYFAPSASVDVGGLVATTHAIDNADFMAGNARLTRNNATGSVVNDGSLRASLGGYIALLAPEVRNNGVIVAQLGTVALAAGEAYTLQFDAPTTLANIQVSPASVNVLVENGNAVHAPGGLIILSAQAANALQGAVVRTSGTLEAKGLSASGGRIFLNAGAGGQTLVSGILDVSATTGTGGRIEVTGERVLIDEGAYLTASGTTGGGDVLVGGSWQNREPTVRQAISTTVASGAQLEANATDRGTGGTVVVWSDIDHPDSVTRAYGSFAARGGPNGGAGGRIETSGHWLDTQGARGSAAAPHGTAGRWLFDPYDITITGANANGSFATGTWTPTGTSTILNTAIDTLLSAGTNVTIATGGTGSAGSDGGDITVSSAITKSAGATTTLALEAARHINVNADITSSSGALNITLSAANTSAAAISTAGTLGGVDVNANLASNGGTILIGGGAGSTTNGIGYALNRSAALSAVTIEANRSITSSGGNITINGKSLVGSSKGNYSGVDGGIYIRSGATILSGTGNLNMYGESSAGSQTFGLAVEATANTVTTLGTSATAGTAVLNGINTTPGASADALADGALGLVNSGSISRVQLLGASVANMSAQVNNSTQLITFTPGTGCVTGYAYCGTLLVPGANNSYLYARYSVNSAATKAITVQTNNGSRNYDGSTSASGLGYTVTGALGTAYDPASLSFLTSSANVGTYSILDNSNPTTYVSGATTYAVSYYSGNYGITAKPITASYTGSHKQYDGTTTGSVSGTSSGVLTADSALVTVNTTAATFADKNVGSSKTISITGASLGGTQAGNYSLASTTGSATANITAKPLTVSGLSASNKVYNGTTEAAVTGTASFGGVIEGDTVTISTSSVTGAFTDKNVGSSKAINLSGVTLAGAQGGNYTVAGVSGVSASITAKALTASASAASRAYDGTITASPTLTITGGLVDGETVTATGAATFNTKDVGSRTATINSNTLSDGSNGLASNYSLATGQTAAANITAKSLTASGLSSADKVYDGTITAVVSDAAALQAAITAGSGTSADGKPYHGDSVSLTGTATGTFSSKEVGSNHTVSFSGKSLTGTGSGNYTLTPHSDDTGKSITAKETPTKEPPASIPVLSPLLQIQSNPPLPGPAPNRGGIVVTLVQQPALDKNGAVSVSLPRDTVAKREGFSFLLPTKIAETISDQSTVQVTTLQGAPLPAWVRYEANTKTFDVSAVPDGVLPMRVLITIDQQQTELTIYERAY